MTATQAPFTSAENPPSRVRAWLGYMVLLEDVTLLQRRNAALSIVKEKLWRSLL